MLILVSCVLLLGEIYCYLRDGRHKSLLPKLYFFKNRHYDTSEISDIHLVKQSAIAIIFVATICSFAGQA
jgi:hypothetical protein